MKKKYIINKISICRNRFYSMINEKKMSYTFILIIPIFALKINKNERIFEDANEKKVTNIEEKCGTSPNNYVEEY